VWLRPWLEGKNARVMNKDLFGYANLKIAILNV